MSEKGWSLYECEAAIRAGDDPLVVLRYAMNAAAERATAAAEERGRRRGLEERDELRALLTQLLAWADHVAPRAGVRMDDPNTGARELARTALAPRDSAPAEDISAAEFRRDPFGILKPRDSGKGFSNADEPFADLVAARDRK